MIWVGTSGYNYPEWRGTFYPEKLAAAILATNEPRRLSAWWLYRMLGTPAQAIEKLTLFWHGHFATSAAKVEDAEAMLESAMAQVRLALDSGPQKPATILIPFHTANF